MLVNGLRDIPLMILLNFIYRSKVIVYVQVPYHFKVQWIDGIRSKLILFVDSGISHILW